ncbi:MAG TPA: hypothetical protein VEA69_18840 [Tepidisphaeraceae bacterium]|nr:hypothetical protein [Tepidisphaeraceae bacterium]
MSLAKRSSRTISVDGVAYRWAVSPDDGYMWLVVERADRAGQRVEAVFEYHDVRGADGRNAGQRRAASPGVVAAVIRHALANGWRPGRGGLKPLRVGGEAVRPVGG